MSPRAIRSTGLTMTAMPVARIHILGASGSGTTTLGAALAIRLSCAHVDADSLFWLLTDPPFTTQRDRNERRVMLQRQLPADGRWVFSGSATGWAASVEPFFDLIVFLSLEPTIRMARLQRREAERYGARIEGTGDMAEASAGFLNWARAYDTAGADIRSRVAHEEWLTTQRAPVLRLDSREPCEHLVSAVIARCNLSHR